MTQRDEQNREATRSVAARLRPTGRYTGSPESDLEFDLARLRGVATAEGFVATLDQVCDSVLTSDFWTITLPNDLATSSGRSPSMFAYFAALVLDEARALFSDQKVETLLDPSVHRGSHGGRRDQGGDVRSIRRADCRGRSPLGAGATSRDPRRDGEMDGRARVRLRRIDARVHEHPTRAESECLLARELHAHPADVGE